MCMFSGIGDFLRNGLREIVEWEAKKRIIKLAEYVIVKCGGVPPTARREPLPPPPTPPLAGGENKEWPPIEDLPRPRMWN